MKKAHISFLILLGIAIFCITLIYYSSKKLPHLAVENMVTPNTGNSSLQSTTSQFIESLVAIPEPTAKTMAPSDRIEKSIPNLNQNAKGEFERCFGSQISPEQLWKKAEAGETTRNVIHFYHGPQKSELRLVYDLFLSDNGKRNDQIALYSIGSDGLPTPQNIDKILNNTSKTPLKTQMKPYEILDGVKKISAVFFTNESKELNKKEFSISAKWKNGTPVYINLNKANSKSKETALSFRCEEVSEDNTSYLLDCFCNITH